MNVFSRSFISMKRCPGRFLILLGSVFLLTTVMSTALSIRQAISNTDMALRASLPAVATIVVDCEAHQQHFEATGEWAFSQLTLTAIREIGDLSYVRDFNYSLLGHDFFSAEIVRAFDKDLFEDFNIPESGRVDHRSLSYWHDTPLEQFTLRGVRDSNILDIDAGLIELVAGRVFIDEEILGLTYAAVVSQDFLNANNLALGSLFALDYYIYDELMKVNFQPSESDENLLPSKPFLFEIVGVFEKEMEDRWVNDIWHYFDFVNRIYVPNAATLSVIDLYLEYLPVLNPELYAELANMDINDIAEEVVSYNEILFLLYDPTYLLAFTDAANNILPEFWIVEDLSRVYLEMANSMAMMNEIASGIAVGALVASLLILSLLIMLFLVDRKREIGIYLALGDRKQNVFFQFMIDAMVPAVIGITIALFVGNIFSGHISHAMIEQDLQRQLENPERVVYSGALGGMGFRTEMTHEEMLNMYEVILEPITVITFYGVSIVTILFALGVPTWMFVRKNPKNILL